VADMKPVLSSKLPLNFLLKCSERALGNYELMRLEKVAHLRSELHTILDNVIDEMAQAGLAAWFRNTDRDALKKAIENGQDTIEWAKTEIRRNGRSAEELVPMPSLPSGAAHLAAALRYQERNIAAGKCCSCPSALDRNSVRFCTRHLERQRERARAKAKELNKPPHGRAPGTLKALALARGKQAEKNSRGKNTVARGDSRGH
jgi:hypothetical protein